MTALTTAQLQLLAPNARLSYRTAFASADTVLARYGINDTALRLAHFMAQMLHESGGLTLLFENLNYSAEGLLKTWPSRFPTIASTVGYAHKPRAIANKVYGGRMGNSGSDDGWRYRGRGLIQLTGKASYVGTTAALRMAFALDGNRAGINFVDDPDLVLDSAWSLHVAGVEWRERGCNAFADADSIVKITKAINGGQIGIASRREWLVKTKHVWLKLGRS